MLQETRSETHAHSLRDGQPGFVLPQSLFFFFPFPLSYSFALHVMDHWFPLFVFVSLSMLFSSLSVWTSSVSSSIIGACVCWMWCWGSAGVMEAGSVRHGGLFSACDGCMSLPQDHTNSTPSRASLATKLWYLWSIYECSGFSTLSSANLILAIL